MGRAGGCLGYPCAQTVVPRYSLSPDVVFREIENEAVLLDLGTGTYFGLNEVGTRVWQMIESGSSKAEIVQVLVTEYEAPESSIATDVERLIRELRARRLISGGDP